MTDCEHEILKKIGWESYACEECGAEVTTSSIGIVKMFGAINKRLDKLVNQRSVKYTGMITGEQQIAKEIHDGDKSDVDIPVLDGSDSKNKKDSSASKPSEEPVSSMTYFTELTKCTIMAESESGKAYQVIKDGFFTWLAKSHVEESAMPLPLGILIPNIPLRKDRQWILGKGKDGKPKLEWKVVGG